jgi:DNA-binding CsgD family transcriptional regulator
MAAAQLGRWDEALAHAGDATHAAGSAPAFAVIGWAVAAVVHVARGADAAATEARAELAGTVAAAGSPRLLASILAAVDAWAAETSGDHDGVLAAFDPWDHGHLTAATRTLVPAVATMPARALTRLGRPDDAAATLEVAPSPTGPVEAAWRAASGGLIAATKTDLATARRLLAGAGALVEGSGHPLDAARIALAHGSVLRRAGKRREARHHLAAAAIGFDELGARPFASHCEAELATSGRSPRRRDADPDGLTPAEQAVADLVVAGRRNREVAAELFVSPKTVEFHLGNVYRKLGVSNRTQLAARLGGAATR